MAKHLVIVESPAKSKTIQKFLGKDYQVKACMGHVRDLPKTKMGIDIENHFQPTYIVISAKNNLIKELTSDAQKASKVFLATDLDREGEAIAWHLAETLHVPPSKIARVIFNEITASSIQAAFQSPMQLQMSKVDAQQARRVLDRIVGYELSPLLWQKFTRGLSAGRVQSVAVKLIVDKEKEIQAFQTEEYWRVIANLASAKSQEQPIEAELKKYKQEKIKISDEKNAKKVVEELKKEVFLIEEINQKEKLEKPLPPFATSQLQQQASIQLGFTAKHTMSVAQQLYEGLELGQEGPIGLITYMRTDSFHISQEAITECRDFISQNYAPNFLPKNQQIYTNKKAQGAHEAIRPSSVFRTPDSIKSFLGRDQYKLYKLIWDRFVASQMSPARISVTNITIQAGDYTLETKGKQLLFPGYQILMPKSTEGDVLLPHLEEKEKMKLLNLKSSQHFTQPPPRYTEATLVKALETKGIGRPSTYAPIISTIQERGYVKIESRAFYATELGMKVTDQLAIFFPKIMDTAFTSEMETRLDEIEESKIAWEKPVADFYQFFSTSLKDAYQNMQSIKKNPEVSPYFCDLCQSPLIYKYNKQGKFLGCSKYPKCKYAVSIDNTGKPIKPEMTEYKCEKCGRNLILRNAKSGKFLGCSGYPECKNTIPANGEGKPLAPEITEEKCEKCGSPMLKKWGPHGPFLSCTRYPECDGRRSLRHSQKADINKFIQSKCEKCGKPMTIRKGRGGAFLGCSGYPDCKNIQKFTLDSLVFPEGFSIPKCPQCNKTLTLKYSSKGIFWGCPGYPQCNHTSPWEF